MVRFPDVARLEQKIGEVPVSVVTVADLVAQMGFDRVDLINLGVEGYESRILLSLPYDRLRPEPEYLRVDADDPRDEATRVCVPRRAGVRVVRVRDGHHGQGQAFQDGLESAGDAGGSRTPGVTMLARLDP